MTTRKKTHYMNTLNTLIILLMHISMRAISFLVASLFAFGDIESA